MGVRVLWARYGTRLLGKPRSIHSFTQHPPLSGLPRMRPWFFYNPIKFPPPTTRTIRPRHPSRAACSFLPPHQERGFLYVHTPIITSSDCEGAGEMFQVTTVLPADAKKEVRRRSGSACAGEREVGRNRPLRCA
jgi:hypothetical protein